MDFTPLLVIPAIVCLFAITMHWLLASHTQTFRILVFLYLSLIMTMFADVMGHPILRYDALAYILVQFAAPFIIPLSCLYFSYLYRPFTYKPLYLLWIIFPAITLTSSVLLTSILGLEKTEAFLHRYHSGLYEGSQLFLDSLEYLYYICTVIVLRVILVIEAVYMVVHCTFLGFRIQMTPKHLSNFLFFGRKIRLLELQIFMAIGIVAIVGIKLFVHGRLFHNTQAWSMTLMMIQGLFYFFFGFFALFGAVEYFSLRDVATAFRFNYTPETRSSVAEEIITEMSPYLNGDSLTRVLSRMGSQIAAPSPNAATETSPSLAMAVMNNVVSLSREKGSLASRFRRLMMDEQLFLQPSLTLSDVAERLHTNKTYVSKMVNQYYKLGFPELLNILRIDYAQQFIRSHPNASQEEIARASGFLSASTFNSTFKRISGFTPKVWAARKER